MTPRSYEVRYLPPYSPDFNPIEMVFSKIKQLLPSMACRTVSLLWQSMQSVLGLIRVRGGARAGRPLTAV